MTPLVLLPGMMCDQRMFAPQIKALGEQRDVMVLAISNHDTVEAIAADVLDKAPDTFALAGLSMGGIIAMQCVAMAAQRIERLALMDTNPLAEAPEMQQLRIPQMEQVRAGKLHEVMRDEMKPRYLADGENKQAILDLCMQMAETLGPQAFINQSKALRIRPDQQAVLTQIDVPTLILCGREDRACPVERHELMHQLIPHAVLTIIEGAGHLPTLEQSEKTTAALATWLEN